MKKIPKTRTSALQITSAALAAAALASAIGAAPFYPTAAARAQTPQRGVVSLSFHNAEAADVLRTFALQSGLSIALSPSVKGRVISIRLRNVTPDEALQLITQSAGLTYRRSTGNAYVIGTEEELRKMRPAADSAAPVALPLKNITPAAAKTLVEGVFPYVTASSVPGSSSILLSGSTQDVIRARQFLANADTPAAPVTEIISPKVISAKTVAEILSRAAPDVTLDVRENVIVATGPRESVARVQALLPSIDVATTSEQRVEIYSIRYSSAAALTAMVAAAIPGVQVTPSAEPYAPLPGTFQSLSGSSGGGLAVGGFGSGGGIGGGAAGIGGSGAAMTAGTGLPGANGTAAGGTSTGYNVSIIKSKHLIITGGDAQVNAALKLLQEVDSAPMQVAITAHVVDLETPNTLDAGVAWGGLQSQTSGGTGGGTGSTSQVFTPGQTQVNGNELNAPGVFRFGRFRRSPLDLAAQLRFLETKGKTKILANPSVAVLDNEDASIFIGEIRRFLVAAVTSATAGTAFTVETVPVGITLLARPRVNANGEITLKVHPQVSTITEITNGLPQVASRESDTTFRVKDGETIAIGGLIRDQDIEIIEQVPLLGEIPLFGELFKRRRRDRIKSEVVVFLTINLLKDNEGVATTPKTIDALREGSKDATVNVVPPSTVPVRKETQNP